MISAIMVFIMTGWVPVASSSYAAEQSRVKPAWNLVSDEEHLKSWLHRQSRVLEKLDAVAREAKRPEASGQETDLRDALAGTVKPRAFPDWPPSAQAAEPVSPPMTEICPTLLQCDMAPHAVRAEDPNKLDAAVTALVRPWLLLEKARGRRLGVMALSRPGTRIFRLKVSDWSPVPLDVNVGDLPGVGPSVWLTGPGDPWQYYAMARHAVIAVPQSP